MNGPEHYAEAERLLAEANEIIKARWRSDHERGPNLTGLDEDTALQKAADAMQVEADWISDPDLPERNIAEARVHAMLALAAAIAGATGGADGQAREDVGAIPPGGTPATDPAHVEGSAMPQLLRQLAQEMGIPPPDPPGR